MTLEPCNVCGTLNSSKVDICLSCGYPTKGRQRSPLFKWVAIGLAGTFIGVVLVGLVAPLFSPPPKPPSPVQNPPTASS